MKTLVQVEPRIPISSAPYSISAPGSYYLTTNLTSSSDGIWISADKVTLDLMGFALSGSGTGNTYGIQIDGSPTAPRRYVTIKNGTIGGYDVGVYCEYAEGCTLEGLTIQSNRTSGIIIYGKGNRVENCVVAYNNDDGIRLRPGGVGGESSGNVIRHCIIGGNAATNDAAAGIQLDGTAGGSCTANLVEDCLIIGNGGPGVKLNGFGGTCHGNRVRGCVLSDNGGPALYLNYCTKNRIEDNHISSTTTDPFALAIRSVAGTNNFILANTSAGYPAGLHLSTNDVYGPLVTNAGELATSGAGAHPWANFVR